MSTVVALIHAVNGSTWADASVHPRQGDLIRLVHEVAGALVVLGAVLLVATAGPRRRSRAVAVVVALVAISIVVVGCAAPASAADGSMSAGAATMRVDPALLAACVLGAAGLLCLWMMRVVLRMVTAFLRILEVVASIRQAAMLITIAVLALAILAAVT